MSYDIIENIIKSHNEISLVLQDGAVHRFIISDKAIVEKVKTNMSFDFDIEENKNQFIKYFIETYWCELIKVEHLISNVGKDFSYKFVCSNSGCLGLNSKNFIIINCDNLYDTKDLLYNYAVKNNMKEVLKDISYIEDCNLIN